VEFRIVNIELVPPIKSNITELTVVDKHLRKMLGFHMVLSMRSLAMILATNCALELGSTRSINSVNVFVQELSALKWDKRLLKTYLFGISMVH
jgi:hypothetical protein